MKLQAFKEDTLLPEGCLITALAEDKIAILGNKKETYTLSSNVYISPNGAKASKGTYKLEDKIAQFNKLYDTSFSIEEVELVDKID